MIPGTLAFFSDLVRVLSCVRKFFIFSGRMIFTKIPYIEMENLVGTARATEWSHFMNKSGPERSLKHCFHVQKPVQVVPYCSSASVEDKSRSVTKVANWIVQSKT